MPIVRLPSDGSLKSIDIDFENAIDESRTEMCSLAYEVCKKCKGLPVAINALGAALKNKPDPVWKNALDKLDRYMITNIEGIDRSVWASLKLSYDELWSSDAKSCFLLCCLYPEDFEIPIEDLMRYCVARRLFSQNPRTLDEARNAACTVVQSLKSASLLSYGKDENFVRIHDVIRDVGISIAFKEEAFLVDHGALQWPRNPINGPPYSAISLRPKKIKRLPKELTCPQLHTLMFGNSSLSHLEVPDNFFSGMKQLVVLIVARMHMGRLPSSLANLAGLGMLCLEHCELADIAILGDLKTSLKVLSLRGSTIEALPQEIGQLTSLLLLDLRDCKELNVIPQGVISNLTSLEELYLPDAFDQWDATEDNRRYTSIQKVTLEELRWSLSTGQLTTLHIHVPNVMLLPKEGLKFENLKRFRISMGSKFKWHEHFLGTRVLKYEGSSLKKEFIPLVDKAEALYLCGIKGLKNVLDDRGVGNEFLDLKFLKVESCDDDLEYLIGEPKSSVRSHGLHPLQSLTELVIENCKLKYLFSPSSARGLVNLELLIVKQCEIMEAIVGFEGQKEDNEVIVSKLKVLRLEGLPNLKCFYAENEKTRTSIGSSFARVQPLFNEKVILPVLEELQVEALDSIEELWDKQSPSVNQGTASFGQLRKMTVKRCTKLVNLVPSNILPRLRNLQVLEVHDCTNVEFVVFKNGNEEEAANDSTLIIPRLSYLWISHMWKLKSFYSSSTTSNAQSLFNHQVILPVLEELEVEALDSIEVIWDKQSPSVNQETASFGQLRNITVRQCTKLINLIPSNILPRLRNLRDLIVVGCPNVEFVVFKNGNEEEAANDSTLIILQLKRLEIRNMKKLKSFYSSSKTSNAQSLFNHQVILPSLEVLKVAALDSIEEIWDKQSTSVIKKTTSFSQLRDMTVEKCEELVNLGPANILPWLRNLQLLTVDSCPNVEFIVLFKNGKEEEAADDSTFIIPQLRYLEIRKMEKFKSFCSSSTTSNAQTLFNHQVIFPVLEKLKIWEVDNIVEICDKQSITVFEAQGSFCQLMNVEVRGCNKLTHLFPSKMHPLLKNLKDLNVQKCESMEGIVGFEGDVDEDGLRNDQVCFSKLTSLSLMDLPKLVSFYIKMGEAGTTESNPSIHAQPLFNGKVAFPVLEDIDISYMPMITDIWPQQPLLKPEKEVESFCKLKSIRVWGCNQLEYVLPSFMLRQLHNLLRLDIANCKELEVIVSKKLKEKEATNNDILIVFPQLKTLELWNLDNLKCFGTGGTDQLFFSHKVAFPALERLAIMQVPMIKEIWDKQPLSEAEKEAISFCNLRRIDVNNCDQLVYVFPSSMLPQLQNLEKLVIINCKKMEVIISNKLKEKEATNNNIILFAELKTVILQFLPNLERLCSDMQLGLSNKDAFPVLEEIDLANDLEFLRNGTSTKEECSTSGKENDHNAEEG